MFPSVCHSYHSHFVFILSVPAHSLDPWSGLSVHSYCFPLVLCSWALRLVFSIPISSCIFLLGSGRASKYRCSLARICFVLALDSVFLLACILVAFSFPSFIQSVPAHSWLVVPWIPGLLWVFLHLASLWFCAYVLSVPACVLHAHLFLLHCRGFVGVGVEYSSSLLPISTSSTISTFGLVLIGPYSVLNAT